MAFENDTPHFNAEPCVDAAKSDGHLNPKNWSRIGHHGLKLKRRANGQAERRVERDDLSKLNRLRRLLLCVALCSALAWLLVLTIKAGFGVGIV